MLTRARLKGAVDAVAMELAATKVAPQQWRGMSEKELWAILLACILGSQVRDDQVAVMMARLDREGMLDPSVIGDLDAYEGETRRLLSGTAADGTKTGAGIRFYRRKAHFIRCAADAVYGQGSSLGSTFELEEDHDALRCDLAESVPGLGLKQASLFLRLVGYAEHFAILDVHVLRFMSTMGLAAEGSPHQSKRGYLRHEAALSSYAQEMGVTMAVLDTSIWVVMGVAADQYGPSGQSPA